MHSDRDAAPTAGDLVRVDDVTGRLDELLATPVADRLAPPRLRTPSAPG